MIGYIGGKSYLSKWVISHFPENYQDNTYCEVFGGGGWVLFRKDESNVEIYNDLDSNIVNLFRIIRDNYDEFKHRAEWSLHSREMYQEAKAKLADDKFLSDMERAMYYAIRQTQSFAGNGSTWGYQITAERITSGKWRPFLNRLDLINARLKRVQIECLDFEKVIKKYDTPNTLFYCDPPYFGAEHYYNVPFSKEDHERLADLLKSIKGKFVLSYYDNEFVNGLYKGLNRDLKDVPKHSSGITVNSKSRQKPRATEQLIMNY